MEQLNEEIKRLKREKDAVILSHYYVDGGVKQVSDMIGDSYYLAEAANRIDSKTIVLCGVSFMGESVKLLNPEKTVLLADRTADCPMAGMYSVEELEAVRRQHPDVAVVCYVNSTAELKSRSDVTVTSSNAVRVIRSLPNQTIYFVPDENLGRFVASQIPEKNFILHKGFCPVHAAITASQVKDARQAHPKARVLAHPECRAEVVALADYVGSTAGIADDAARWDGDTCIVCTEMGILYDLRNRNSEKTFCFPGEPQCSGMKKITPEKILHVLRTGENEVTVDGAYAEKARASLQRMLELSRT